MCMQRPEQGVGYPDAVVTGGYKMPSMGTGNKTLQEQQALLITDPSISSAPTHTFFSTKQINSSMMIFVF